MLGKIRPEIKLNINREVPKEDMVKITVAIPRELDDELQRIRWSGGKKTFIGKFVADAIREALAKRKETILQENK